MDKREAAKIWDKVIFGGNTCIKCVLNPPRDNSICSDCVSSGARNRALEAIRETERETGYTVSLRYEKGTYILKLKEIENEQISR